MTIHELTTDMPTNTRAPAWSREITNIEWDIIPFPFKDPFGNYITWNNDGSGKTSFKKRLVDQKILLKIIFQ